ncbi:MAG: hypothetical protein QOF76_3014 [Solirubrobacteraceae bacterium]|jgi:hypothetical protein|nr:hypothetical protein [Solirubrobacteraceae bacterium]
MSPRKTITIAALTTAAVAGTIAAPAGARSPIPEVNVTVDRAGVHAPREIPPGITRFTTVSHTGGIQSLLIARLNPGVSYGQLQKYMSKGDFPSVFKNVTGKGGISHAGTHTDHGWTTDLTPGRYILVDDENGGAAPIRVRGVRGEAKAPHAKGAVRFRNGRFHLPRGFGDGTWKIVNRDSLAHEIGFVHVAPGHSRAEVLAAVRSGKHPAWTRPDATYNVLGSGQAQWVTLRHLRGLYAVMDYLPMLQGAADAPVVAFRRFHAAARDSAATSSTFDVAFGADPFIDLPPAGMSVGDLRLLDDRLLRHGRSAGSDSGVCVIANIRTPAAPCTVTWRLPHGTITGQWINQPPPRKVVAITGGTGAYRNVAGQAIVVEHSTDRGTVTFHLS